CANYACANYACANYACAESPSNRFVRSRIAGTHLRATPNGTGASGAGGTSCASGTSCRRSGSDAHDDATPCHEHAARNDNA
ncbi:MAG TPA: hypothetical protein VN764_16230, partial [Polyangiaceae bacterium]|nr:hypothetical protein [Polyangiaceae bacterium]